MSSEVDFFDNKASKFDHLAELPELAGMTLQFGRNWVGGYSVKLDYGNWDWEWILPNGIDVTQDIKRNKIWKKKIAGTNSVDKRLILSRLIDMDTLFIIPNAKDPWFQVSLSGGEKTLYNIEGYRDANAYTPEVRECAEILVACYQCLSPDRLLKLAQISQPLAEVVWTEAAKRNMRTDYMPTPQKEKELLSSKKQKRLGRVGGLLKRLRL